ncbi:GntR family transcriptional regulator [Micromonospora avicenniae]|uniref:GntR family transcriptional regulator n=1 Tax=Micromonospora avicenniae TaxID=1198245 RepID=A0A1N7F073_9ACTN|nr:GntR family transcriptional regulator [Micromonospora avicenniae]SIR93717.1 GntR family transcriptional regulator [Micromonospora avicenniae]
MPARQFEPHYRRIIADIRGRIASGEWPPGHKLPSTKALAEMYEVGSATTVRQAITILIETGELYGHQGLGVFVAERPQGQP